MYPVLDLRLRQQLEDRYRLIVSTTLPAFQVLNGPTQTRDGRLDERVAYTRAPMMQLR